MFFPQPLKKKIFSSIFQLDTTRSTLVEGRGALALKIQDIVQLHYSHSQILRWRVSWFINLCSKSFRPHDVVNFLRLFERKFLRLLIIVLQNGFEGFKKWILERILWKMKTRLAMRLVVEKKKENEIKKNTKENMRKLFFLVLDICWLFLFSISWQNEGRKNNIRGALFYLLIHANSSLGFVWIPSASLEYNFRAFCHSFWLIGVEFDNKIVSSTTRFKALRCGRF